MINEFGDFYPYEYIWGGDYDACLSGVNYGEVMYRTDSGTKSTYGVVITCRGAETQTQTLDVNMKLN